MTLDKRKENMCFWVTFSNRHQKYYIPLLLKRHVDQLTASRNDCLICEV